MGRNARIPKQNATPALPLVFESLKTCWHRLIGDARLPDALNTSVPMGSRAVATKSQVYEAWQLLTRNQYSAKPPVRDDKSRSVDDNRGAHDNEDEHQDEDERKNDGISMNEYMNDGDGDEGY